MRRPQHEADRTKCRAEYLTRHSIFNRFWFRVLSSLGIVSELTLWYNGCVDPPCLEPSAPLLKRPLPMVPPNTKPPAHGSGNGSAQPFYIKLLLFVCNQILQPFF